MAEHPIPDGPSQGPPPTPEQIAQPLAEALIARRTLLPQPVFLGLDGRSGAGKSTLAAAIAGACRSRDVTVTVIAGDDFYTGGTGERWDQWSPADAVDRAIDWPRQYRVLGDLRMRGTASWFPFDWESPDWDREPAPLRSTPVSAASADIVILEGVYSARPELHDVLDMLVLLARPAQQRRRQLVQREGDNYRPDWEARWSAAEDHYFGMVMPPERFEHIL